ncbi:DNA-binding protein [Hoyosella sp. YIM 151337]|uniref:DNA-binding protein n=1 Tax=Hoyosella sp. YIM 151337 TaxID=2992742 RepID=UPI0022363691|nr:DNA-binding protein [Hoyosella sp. YIM 151337]MCW4354429.1 DNA-binding protein [Hoyosella sp. YIM 151337]
MERDDLNTPDAGRARAEREYTCLFRIAERHADSESRRARSSNQHLVEPHEAVRLVAGLAGGSLVPDGDEPDVDEEDVMAALTLMPKVRADLDQLEAMLLLAGRQRDMTWQRIAYGLGLGSAQAARQRYERLTQRTT